MSERLNELYILTQKAQKMEMINEEVALAIYLEIFEKYTPKISKSYESAIRLLEKRQRFVEALSICDRAIELIKLDEISGTIEKFDAIHNRLKRKMEENGIVDVPVSKRKVKFKPIYALIIFLIILSVALLLKYTTPYDDLDVNLEGKEAIDGGDQVFGETTSPVDSETRKYPITENMIAFATEELKKNIEINDASIIPQTDTLGFAIIVNPGTTEKRSKELAINYVKSLGASGAANYKDLKGPSANSFGDLYNYYEIIITVGTGVKDDKFIARGTKIKDSSEIYWRK